MKLSVPAKSYLVLDGVLTPNQCDEIVQVLRQEDRARWIRRSEFQTGRGMPGQTCNYYFGGHHTFKKETADLLISHAPFLDGFGLDEVCVNMYLPGDGIGLHTDRRHPRNMVVSLHDNKEQGCLIGDELLYDIKGRAVVHPGVSLPHSVPNVKVERFVLIYLYDYQGALQCRHQKLALNASKP